MKTEPLRAPSTSKVHIESERAALALLGCRRHDSRLLVLAHPFFEEVGLALQGDQLHPIERVGGVEDLRVAECGEKAVGHELDVLRHEVVVHTDQVARESFRDELAFYVHRAANHMMHDLVGQTCSGACHTRGTQTRHASLRRGR